MTANEVLAAIRDGVMDDRFDEVYEALQVRQNLRNAEQLTAMTVGTRVMTDRQCRPVHRRHKMATVVEVKARSGKVVIKFDDRPSQTWTWPAGMLVVVEDEVSEQAAKWLAERER